MKRKWLIPCLMAIVVVAIIFFTAMLRKHTFTLAERGEETLKHEQIRPLLGTVKVSGDRDTDVVFTDIETGETYTVGYITPGVSAKIKLQKGKWYTVDGAGTITIRPVDVRIE